jgi:hypothetical protein
VAFQRIGLSKPQKPSELPVQEPASVEFPFTEQGDHEHDLFTKLSVLDSNIERTMVLRVLGRPKTAEPTDLGESEAAEAIPPASVQSLRPTSGHSVQSSSVKSSRTGTPSPGSLLQRSGAQSHRGHRRREADLIPPRCASSMRVRHMAAPTIRRSAAC